MSEKKSGFEIAESQRQSWKSIALVWIGAMICVACLMVGGMLGEGMSIGTCIITILIGYGIVCLYELYGDAGVRYRTSHCGNGRRCIGRDRRKVCNQCDSCDCLHRLVRDSGSGLRRIFFLHDRIYDGG